MNTGRSDRKRILTGIAAIVTFTATAAQAVCPVTPDVTCKFAYGAGLGYADKADDTRDTLSFKLSKGASSNAADFGDPTATTDYDVCLYGDGDLLYSMSVPADGDCSDGACWVFKSKGPAYKDKLGSHDGITAISLSSPSDGTDKTKIGVKGKGAALPDLGLPLPEAINVQVRNSLGKCWNAIFTGATQDPAKGKLKAKSKLEALPTCTDEALNAYETDFNCGGNCAPCTYAQNCLTGSDCTSGLCSAGKCYAKRVFVTSSTVDGRFNFNGLGILTNADNLCNSVAASAFLSGTYVAWLSTPTVNAIDRVADAEYRLRDGTLLFINKAQMLDPGRPFEAISQNQLGQPISGSYWTATSGGAYFAGNDCSGWTTNSSLVSGWYGSTTSIYTWSITGADTCNNSKHLLCFEQ